MLRAALALRQGRAAEVTRVKISTQRPRRPADTTPAPDVRVMNALAGILLMGAVVVMASSAWGAMQRSPYFAVRSIEVVTPLERADVQSMRNLAAPHAAGNFFALDMPQVRAAFEAVPWVRRAHVRRLWPNGLEVRIEEHRAVAFWDGGEGDDQLVNEYGEVFDANVGEVEEEGLPMLGGPEGSSRHVLTVHQKLLPLMASLDARIEDLRLSRRGSWRVTLDSGAQLDLGRGKDMFDTAEVFERTARFVRTYQDVSSRFGHPKLQHADLRHTNGYALQLQGVSVQNADDGKNNSAKKR